MTPLFFLWSHFFYASLGGGFSAERKDFSASGRINHQAFYEKTRTALSYELAKLIGLTHQDACNVENAIQLKGSGFYVEEADLDAKYSSKPEHLAAIKANTRRID